jgi:hypothetical protein
MKDLSILIHFIIVDSEDKIGQCEIGSASERIRNDRKTYSIICQQQICALSLK